MQNYGVVFSEFCGYAENKIYAFWFQKWPKDGLIAMIT